MRHSYLAPGIDKEAVIRYAKERRGERTQIHEHPYREGMGRHDSIHVVLETGVEERPCVIVKGRS